MADNLMALGAIFGLLVAGSKLLAETMRASLKPVNKEHEERSLVALLAVGFLGFVLILTACCLAYRFVETIIAGNGSSYQCQSGASMDLAGSSWRKLESLVHA